MWHEYDREWRQRQEQEQWQELAGRDMTAQWLYGVVADVTLAAHLAVAAYIILGLPAVWIGSLLRLGFARSPWFRLSHLGAIAVVSAEALAGADCPLTTLESWLRGAGGETSPYGPEGFIASWMERLLFHDWSEETFMALYLGFLALTLLTLWLVPIRRRAGKHPGGDGA